MTSITNAFPIQSTHPLRDIRPKGFASWLRVAFRRRCNEPYWDMPLTAACRVIPPWPEPSLVRPSRSLQDLEVSSVKKKLKDKAFARGVSREDVFQGAEELGVPLDEHIAFLLAALRPHEKSLGLGVG